MKTLKLSFDFSDQPELVELLRIQSAKSRKSQKGILIEALKAYFSEHLDASQLYSIAEKTFADWANETDKIYDTI